MINRIKNLMNNIVEDYTSDKDKLSEASSIFENFQNKLTDIKPSDLKTIYVNQGGSRFLSYIIDYSKIDERYENLNFLLVGNRYADEKSLKTIQYTGDPSYISNKKIGDRELNLVSIPLGYSTVLQTYQEILNDWGEYAQGMFEDELKKIQNQVLSKRYIIIHELVHYLDELKYTDTYSYKGYKNPSKGYSFKDYINQPEEYNAFYLQSIYKLNQNLEIDPYFDDSKKEVIVEAFKSFDNFLEYYKESCSRYIGGKVPDFKLWFGKYLKKIQKRLYQYYINKKSELGI